MAHPLAFVFLLTASWMARSIHSFPVHHFGRSKDVTLQNENREHLLCWNVQIITHSKCGAALDEQGESHVPGTEGDGKYDGPATPVEVVYELPGRCGSSTESEQHAKEVASELSLVVIRGFQEFHDHYLMCHTNQTQHAHRDTFPGKSLFSHVHHEHGKMKSQNIDGFYRLKREKEGRLSLHHEVLQFSQEFAFNRHSRRVTDAVPAGGSLTPNKVQLGVLTGGHQSHLIPMLPYLKSIAKTFASSNKPDIKQEVQVSDKDNVISGIKKIHEQYYQVMCSATNFSSCESVTELGSCSPTHFCGLLAKLSKSYPSSHIDKSNVNYSTSKSVYFSNHLCNLLSIEMKQCLTLVDSFKEFYEKCSSILLHQSKRNEFLKSFRIHIKNFFSTLGILKNGGILPRNGGSLVFPANTPKRLSIVTVPKTSKRHKTLRSDTVKGQIPEASFSEELQRERRSRRAIRSSTDEEDYVLHFNDPAFPHQWHLHNRVTPSMDVNVTGVWRRNLTGQGVTVAVVDDGVEWRNPDLKGNYNRHGSWDLNDHDPDPSPSTKKAANHHGTRCAGEIGAVANNKICGVGVAYSAKISGLRVLDGVMTDSLEAEAFNKKMDINDIYSCSWGPDDDGKTVDGPHLMAAKAMKHGVDFGRRGYGSIFVVASGNGGTKHDNCNFDGYANSIYTVTVGAVDDNGRMPYYAEECASMLGVTFSSGMNNKRDIVTSDWTYKNPGGCTERHTGTSAAAPLAAGLIALVLGARPCLGWRDVQYIVILTARKIDVDLAHWQTNGAGLSHSHKHGFGLLDGWRMVSAARVWDPVPWMTSFSYTSDERSNDGGLMTIPKGPKNPLTVHHSVREEDIRGYGLSVLESVQVTVWLSHPCRGKLAIKLVSPSGTVSVIAAPRPKDDSSAGFQGWTFTTVRCWGEVPMGNWTLTVMDHDTTKKFVTGRLIKWRLTLFGTPMTPEEFQRRKRAVESSWDGQSLRSNHTASCQPPPLYHEQPSYLSERTLKIVVLASAFCLVMALYETMEYLLCYGEEKEEQARETKLALRALRSANRINSSASTTANGSNANNNNTADGDPCLSLNPDDPSVLPGGEASSDSLSTRDRSRLLDLETESMVANEDGGDDDEDDIFDASEIPLLLSASSSASTSSSARKAVSGHHRSSQSTATHSANINDDADRILSRPFSVASSNEAIPMSTFSVSSPCRNDGRSS